MGSMNYAKYSRRRRDFVFSMVFANPFEEIIALLEAMNELGIKPEHECFDLGHVGSLEPLVHKGVLREPLHVSCVMGVLGGVPPTARNLAAMVDNIPAGSHWGLIGISRVQWTLVAAALALGGSVRVGLEDNFYLPDGEMARSNGDLVARARRMTEDAGRRVATVDEARACWMRHERAARRASACSTCQPAAAGRVLLAAARRLRRRRAQGRGHGARRLHPLGAARDRRAWSRARPRRCSSRSTAASARSGST